MSKSDSDDIVTSWPEIPVIVLNWNGIDDTRECMDALLQLDYADFNIVLLDNASDNEEGLALYQEFSHLANVRVKLFEDNLGFTGAHNQVIPGLVSEGFKYVALVNNDTVADREWLKQLVLVAENESADVVSSKLIDYYDRRALDNVGHQMLTTGEIIPLGFRENPNNYMEVIENFGSCGGATLYRSSLIEEIGFFDDTFSTGYEDAEFGARAIVTGHRAVLAPKARVYHKISRSVAKVRTDEYELMIRNAIWYSYLKLMPHTLIRSSMILIGLKQLLVLSLYLITFDFRSLGLTWQSLMTFRARARSDEDSWITQWSQSGNPVLATEDLRAKQTPFFWHDIRRFVHVFLYRRH